MPKTNANFDFANVQDSFTWPVRWEQPVGYRDGKKIFKEGVFTAEFFLLGDDEVNDILQASQQSHIAEYDDYEDVEIETDSENDDDIAEEKSKAVKDAHLALRILKGWKKGIDNNGEAMPVTDENRSKVCNLIFMRNAIIAAFFASQGGKKAQRKN